MMNSDMATAIHEATSVVLETMFFTETEPAGETAAHHAARRGRIEYLGAEQGRFEVTVDEEALELLCCAFYGQDSPPSPAQRGELLAELTNMMAGSALSHYAPERACQLSSPQVVSESDGEEWISASQERIAARFQIDGGLLTVVCQPRVTHE